jgi:hypothetical protein
MFYALCLLLMLSASWHSYKFYRFEAFVLSRLDYCNAALSGLPQTTLRLLQRAQNAAARLVTNTGSRDHITPAMKDSNWLPINQRIKYKLCLMMHLIHTQQCPDYMRDLVSTTATATTRTGLRSASGLSYWKPRVRTKFGERAFSFSGLAAWNSLPIHLQTATNTNTFKRQLKTYLFTTAYYIELSLCYSRFFLNFGLQFFAELH